MLSREQCYVGDTELIFSEAQTAKELMLDAVVDFNLALEKAGDKRQVVFLIPESELSIRLFEVVGAEGKVTSVNLYNEVSIANLIKGFYTYEGVVSYLLNKSNDTM